MSQQTEERQDASAGAEPPVARPVPPSPGALLRQARENAGLSIDDVGAQLKLSRPILEALEHDDFAALNEPLYVRGYYRRCAKILPVPEKDLLAAYEACVNAKPVAPPAKISWVGGTSRTRGRAASWTGRAVLGVIGGLLIAGVWMANRRPAITTSALAPPVPPVRPVARPSAPPAARVPTDDVAADDSEPGPAEASTGSALSAEPVPAASPPTGRITVPPTTPPAAAVVPPASRTPPPGAAATPPASRTPPPAPSAASGPGTPQATTGAAPTAVTAPSAAPPRPAPTTAGTAQLKLGFGDNSWVRVEDAQGNIELSGLVLKGENKIIRGQPPFTIFLGNAPAVTLEYQGRPVNLEPYTQGNNTARLTLPK